MRAAIEVRKLRKEFDDVAALDCVNLTVPEGAVYGLVGPNGAGKSTLMGHLTGALRPTGGTVSVLGEPVWENPAVKARIGSVPSDPFFFSNETIRGMAQFYYDVFPSFDLARFETVGKSFDLDRKRPLRKFSKGMRKQAAFWLTLSLTPDVLLLDEPMDGLDPLVRKRMWRLVLNDVAERNTTVLVSSHNLRELEGICDHMGILRQGTMLREYDLTRASDGLVKVQVVLPEGAELPRGLWIANQAASGRMQTLIVHGDVGHVREVLSTAHPVYMETVPLSLEELFLYELGGADDELKDLVL
ncbi:MAG: ABC transporter ATP-binding protein [Olsenella sp.]|nr:ABC transporter ATP-binding protein [Olsenella sp.]